MSNADGSQSLSRIWGVSVVGGFLLVPSFCVFPLAAYGKQAGRITDWFSGFVPVVQAVEAWPVVSVAGYYLDL